jgi:hypothetical protein
LAKPGWHAETTVDQGLVALPRFEQLVVATNGAMALMSTIHPMEFVKLKREHGVDTTRERPKRAKDLLHADLVEALVHSHMPHHVPGPDIDLT